MTVVPPVAGLLLDVTRSARTPVVFAGVLWLMIIPPLLVFRILVPRPPPPRPAPGSGSGRA